MPNKRTFKHTKHVALEKPLGGEYHRNEWGIIGAPCTLIKDLVKDLGLILKDHLELGFIDALHKKSAKRGPISLSYTDKISSQEIHFKTQPQQKQYRKYFNELDLLLVNGNHFKADKQIVIIHEEKKESLSRKIDRLDNIKMILLQSDRDEIYDFVIQQIKDESKLVVLKLKETAKIAQAILKDMQDSTPPLFGLVLSGGKSQRMGEDKGALDYHGKPQREHQAELVSKVCHRTFISCRKNQDELIETKFDKVYDTFTGLGPYGGILSAFRAYPNSAWMTLACDLPFMNDISVKELFKGRNPNKLATCFHNPETEFPEPLITIWEPEAYPVLLEFLSQGYSCPRKVLINSDIEELHMSDPLFMRNVNDKEQYKEVKSILNN